MRAAAIVQRIATQAATVDHVASGVTSIATSNIVTAITAIAAEIQQLRSVQVQTGIANETRGKQVLIGAPEIIADHGSEQGSPPLRSFASTTQARCKKQYLPRTQAPCVLRLQVEQQRI